MPDFHVFYYRHRTGQSIDSYHPKPMPLPRILELALQVLENTGDFLGLVDDREGLLQFIYMADNEGDERPIRMEITDPAHQDCQTKRVSQSEMLDVLHRLPARFSIDAVPGFQLVDSREATVIPSWRLRPWSQVRAAPPSRARSDCAGA
ncbi:MAG: hypothetical protein ACRBM6_15585 [Geminicoccales bacterium]